MCALFSKGFLSAGESGYQLPHKERRKREKNSKIERKESLNLDEQNQEKKKADQQGWRTLQRFSPKSKKRAWRKEAENPLVGKQKSLLCRNRTSDNSISVTHYSRMLYQLS